MISVVLAALCAALGTWALTALGAATVVLFKSTNEKVLNLMLGFAAGVMVAASFFSLLAPAVERAGENGGILPPFLVVTAGFLCGALFMWGSDAAVNAARRFQQSRRETPGRANRVLLLVFSITLHNIPEGLAVGVAFGALSGAGYSPETLMGAITVALGIGIQNFPEGAAVSLPLRREGCSRRKSFFWGQASGMVEPIAAVIGALSVSVMSQILPFALSFAAGAMVLVVVHELIPECQENRETVPYLSTMGIILGFSVMMLLDVALG